MQKFNIEDGLVQVDEVLYKSSVKEVLLDNQVETFFHATVDIHEGYLFLHVLFNIFSGENCVKTLEEHQNYVIIDGRPTCNLHFADDFSGMHRQQPTDRECQYISMETSTNKSWLMEKSNGVQLK